MLNATEGQFKLVSVDMDSGDQTTIQNVGGETHTFTRVKNFGGGFKARLNGLTGNSDLAPECAHVLPDGTLAPQPASGQKYTPTAAATRDLGRLGGPRCVLFREDATLSAKTW